MDWAFVTRLVEALITDKNYLEKPVVKEDHQMSLFDMDMPEVQTAAESTPQEKADSTSQMRISQEVIDELLRLGGCTRNSNMRIYEYYRRAKGSEETIGGRYLLTAFILVIDGTAHRITACSRSRYGKGRNKCYEHQYHCENS